MKLEEGSTRERGRARSAFRYVEHAPLGWHVTMRLEDDGWLARTPGDMRRTAGLIHLHLAGRLLCFRVVDTHVHVLASGERASLGRRVQNLESALRQALGTVAFEPARFRPVATQRHLHAAMPYVLRQTARHGASLDPEHDGSILPDLLGLRVLPTEVVPHVTMFFPRLEAATLRAWGELEELAGFAPDSRFLADAAAAALALPDLRSNTPATCLARRAAVHALPLTSGETARLLDIDVCSVSRLRNRPVPPALVRAVELQVRLRTATSARRRSF